ncbi:hypothetical protein CPAR01_11005 [Colletotrichum paranaense]|uniref:Uncharacterized protein n=1 Tax=Colletotrichum paranaense TaxID=1914294 RepID=A0ABQ9SBI0_9PEZI|nr:uncharacterized protein CPAR01_11005 [Colletotrichum paranaense]KAK1531356.1 hypothetical protein CPAR01_11005 [Colletotrichum paranaense]
MTVVIQSSRFDIGSHLQVAGQLVVRGGPRQWECVKCPSIPAVSLGRQPPPGTRVALMALVPLLAFLWCSACRGNLVELLETKRALVPRLASRHSGEGRYGYLVKNLPWRSTALKISLCAAAVGNKLSSDELETSASGPGVLGWFLVSLGRRAVLCEHDLANI